MSRRAEHGAAAAMDRCYLFIRTVALHPRTGTDTVGPLSMNSDGCACCPAGGSVRCY